MPSRLHVVNTNGALTLNRRVTNRLTPPRAREYLPELARVHAAREANLAAKKADSVNRLMKDLAVDRAANPGAFENDRWGPDQLEDEEGDGDDGDASDGDIIDRSTTLPFIGISSFLLD